MSTIDVQFLGPDARTSLAGARRAEAAATTVAGAITGITAAQAAALSAIAAAAAAADLNPPNATRQRFLDSVTAAGSTVGATEQAALLDVEHRLRTSGLLAKIVRLDLFTGAGPAAARIPFAKRPGCGNSSATGTLSSFTQSAGLTGVTLDTGVTLQQAGLGGYNIGLYAYTLADGTTDEGLVVGGSGWGLDPNTGNAGFSTAGFYTFDYSGRVIGDSATLAGGSSAGYRSGGSIHGLRLPSGKGVIVRNGVQLNGGSISTPPDDTLVIPTDTIKYTVTGPALGAAAITDGFTADDAAMLHWIIHPYNVAIGRSAVGEGI